MKLDRLKELTKDGKIFGVRFIKRTDGALRVMACRTGVAPPATGPNPAERNWNPDDYGLLTVWDVHKRGYRHVPADSVQELRVRGQRIPG